MDKTREVESWKAVEAWEERRWEAEQTRKKAHEAMDVAARASKIAAQTVENSKRLLEDAEVAKLLVGVKNMARRRSKTRGSAAAAATAGSIQHTAAAAAVGVKHTAFSAAAAIFDQHTAASTAAAATAACAQRTAAPAAAATEGCVRSAAVTAAEALPGASPGF